MRTRAVLVLLGTLAALQLACTTSSNAMLSCRLDEESLVLTAQAVPSATLVPCVAELPAGWSYTGTDIRSGRARFWLDSDRGGYHAVEVELTRSCDTSKAVEVRPGPDESGARVYAEPIALEPALWANRYVVFAGGCTTYRYRFAPDAPSTLSLEAEEALGFFPRSALVEDVEERFGLTLCGAGAPPCER
ncbi:MAG TPA: hypothetical protein VFT27_00110 [Actinomycetota bacterium]|nr:hypothetical protein [Actinomycetota bacterium]